MIPWFEKHNKISWTITITAAIAIFYISSRTFQSVSASGLNIVPTAYHILAFFFFSLLLLISIRGKRKAFLFLGIILALLYAISDEIHQLFVPGRNGSVFDVFLDSIGILAASVFYYLNKIKTKPTFINSLLLGFL